MNSEFYNHELVSTLIERYCDEHNIKEGDYAALIEVHPASLSRIKAGKMCSPEILAKIAALGKMSLGDLMRPAPETSRNQLFQVGKSKNLPVCV